MTTERQKAYITKKSQQSASEGMGARLIAEETRKRDLEHFQMVQDSRPLKPPHKRVR